MASLPAGQDPYIIKLLRSATRTGLSLYPHATPEELARWIILKFCHNMTEALADTALQCVREERAAREMGVLPDIGDPIRTP